MKKQCEVQPDLQTAQAEPGPPQPQDLGRKAKSESTATSKDSLLLRLRKSFVSMALAWDIMSKPQRKGEQTAGSLTIKIATAVGLYQVCCCLPGAAPLLPSELPANTYTCSPKPAKHNTQLPCVLVFDTHVHVPASAELGKAARHALSEIEVSPVALWISAKAAQN